VLSSEVGLGHLKHGGGVQGPEVQQTKETSPGAGSAMD